MDNNTPDLARYALLTPLLDAEDLTAFERARVRIVQKDSQNFPASGRYENRYYGPINTMLTTIFRRYGFMVKPQGVVRERIDGLRPEWDEEDANRSTDTASSTLSLTKLVEFKKTFEEKMRAVACALDLLYHPEGGVPESGAHQSRPRRAADSVDLMMAHVTASDAIGAIHSSADELFKAMDADTASVMSLDLIGRQVSDARAGVHVPDFIVVREVKVIEVKRCREPGQAVKNNRAQLQQYLDRLQGENNTATHPILGILIWAQNGLALRISTVEDDDEIAELGGRTFCRWLKRAYDLAMSITEPVPARESVVSNN